MNQWFYVKGGQQAGPISAPQVMEKVRSGEFKIAETLVWREGLANWKPIAESGVLAEAGGALVAVPAAGGYQKSEANNPYVVSEHGRTALSMESSSASAYPGWGRLKYFLLNLAGNLVIGIVLAVLLGIAGAMAARTPDSAEPTTAILIIGVLVSYAGIIAWGFFTGVQRVRNLGMSGWAVLWSLVPFMNIWIAWRMIACPEGYEQHRSLDTAGKVITWVMVGFMVFYFVAIIIAVISGGR